MALIAPQPVTVTGLISPTFPTYVAVSGSDTIAADTGLILHVLNVGGSTDNVAVVFPGTHESGQPVPDAAIAVPATTGKAFIRIPMSAADPATGLVTVTHSFTTTVTCALLKVG
jgi:hypothetical protein